MVSDRLLYMINGRAYSKDDGAAGPTTPTDRDLEGHHLAWELAGAACRMPPSPMSDTRKSRPDVGLTSNGRRND